MGHVVSRTAAADDILKDANTAHEQGIARGGKTGEIVEHRLAPTLGLLDTVENERKPLEEQLVTLRATRDASAARAEALVGECFDVVWNRVGRPRVDSRLDLMFPGGVGAYTDGSVETLPDRMGVLIDLLGRNLHPQLTSDLTTEWATKLAPARAELAAANTAIVAPLVRNNVLDRVYYSLVRTVQAGLVATKRDLKSEGFSEAQIHEIIPDRKSASTKPAAEDPKTDAQAAKPAAEAPKTDPLATPTPTNGAGAPKPALTTT